MTMMLGRASQTVRRIRTKCNKGVEITSYRLLKCESISLPQAPQTVAVALIAEREVRVVIDAHGGARLSRKLALESLERLPAGLRYHKD